LNTKIRHWVFKIAVGLAVVALALFLIFVGYSADWTGFGDFTPPVADFQRRKTLWDWMELIFIPLVLFFIARYFSNRETQRAEEQQKIERERAIEHQQEEILQTYLDRMQHLILEKDLLTSKEGTPIANFARTLTLVTLERLAPEGKTLVLQFLDEARLIQQDTSGKRIISLCDANLGAVGQPIGLAWADLQGADLRSADLRNARLDFPNFQNADLSICVLEGASLLYADLRGANLTTALLEGTNLYEAQFDRSTILPNGEPWSNTDMRIFKAVLEPPLTEEEANEIQRELHMRQST
jgi:uncharacterized protein YjbI with pentapeptide repeats